MISRRTALIAIAGALSGCQTAQMPQPEVSADPYAGWYTGSRPDGEFDIALVDRDRMRPELRPQVVSWDGREGPGTIVIDIGQRFLYLVQEGGTARRYGVGVGREGFAFNGVARVGRKAHWPDWSPTQNMLRFKPELPRYMKGGPENPLGARALYLYQGDRDTMFRIHGTNEPWSIGEQVSSGCIRLLNEDVVDLYERVPVGTTVVVRRSRRRGDPEA